MKPRSKEDKHRQGRGRTDVEGQNPKADDATHKDVYHDDNRRNMYDPEVAEALKGGKKKD